ncbi:MAG: PaaI family thioesterase [Azospirillaceae bacterium]|nr:PaaI family thioesterase [Azospirillaceae bacterium]
MTDQPELPEGYSHTPSPSAFINHIGRIYHRRTTAEDGTELVWAALRIEPHHVNTWGLAHAAVMAGMADIGTAGPAYVDGGPPVVVIDLATQFIAAPKLGDLLEVKGWTTKRTRSLVFAQARAEVAGQLIFTATAIHKIVGA